MGKGVTEGVGPPPPHIQPVLLLFLPQGVWSDEEDCLSVLCEEMEELSLPANKMDTILEKISALFANKVGVAIKEDKEEEELADEDEEDEGEYDYYDGDDDVEDARPEPRRYYCSHFLLRMCYCTCHE